MHDDVPLGLDPSMNDVQDEASSESSCCRASCEHKKTLINNINQHGSKSADKN